MATERQLDEVPGGAQGRRTGSDSELLLAFWRHELAGAPAVLSLPVDRLLTAAPERSVRPAGGRELRLPDGVALEVRRMARNAGTTPFVVAAAAFGALLARVCGQDDLLVGVPAGKRADPELAGANGLFGDVVVLRIRVDGGAAFVDLLARVRESALAAFAHQALPFAALIEELRPERRPGRMPLVQVTLDWRDAVAAGADAPGAAVADAAVAAAAAAGAQAVAAGTAPLPPVERGAATFDLSLLLVEDGSGGVPTLRATLGYAADLFTPAAAARLLEHYATLLAAAVRDPGCRVDGLALLTAAERQQLREWNDTATRLAPLPPRGGCLHDLIAEQARRTPDAVAVAADGGGRAEAEDGGEVEASLTFGELTARAGGLARRLRRLGAGPDSVVAVCAERSCSLMVALVGILQAGAAYLPLDPDLPDERLYLMLADSGAVALVAPRALAARLGDALPAARMLDPDAPACGPAAAGGRGGWDAAAAPGPPSPGASPDNLAYVIYTSGSTGRPKGTMNSHRGIVNRLLWIQERHGLTASDRLLQKTPIGFDVSVGELFWPLVAGARLVLARPGGHRDPAYLRQVIARQEITVAHFVPSMLRAFLDDAAAADGGVPPRLPSLRRAMASGEALGYELQQRWFALGSSGAKASPEHDALGGSGAQASPGHGAPGSSGIALAAPLLNLYGPTEAAVEVTSWPCDPTSARPLVPIGRPVANTRIHLLDRAGQEVPIGVPGELYIGGVQVARGYLARPALTAERFVPDPAAGHHGEPGARLYRTGDLARWLADGAIDFLGRLDHQVKVRGQRIELGEIEVALVRHPAVAAAVAALESASASGTGTSAAADARLVAWIVPAKGAAATDDPERLVTELRESLLRILPEAMVPMAFVVLPELPLTASGKIDRRALPAPAPHARGAAAAAVPLTAVEAGIAAIWEEVLPAGPGLAVAAGDNFFDLGGHSLLGARVMSRLRQRFGADLPLRELFAAPTVTALARRVEQALRTAAAPPVTAIRAVAPGSLVPLSFAQQRLWFIDRLAPGSPTYNIPTAWRLPADLPPPALAAALSEVVRRHQALRTRFVVVDGEPWQEVAPAAPVPLPVVDLGHCAPAARAAAAGARLAAAEAARPFDLERGPLLRAVLVRRGAPGQVSGDESRDASGRESARRGGDAPLLLLTVHHIVFDGWSEAVLAGELAALCHAAVERLASPLASLPVQYADFAAWQRSWPRAVLASQLAWWRDELAGAPDVLELPTDRPRPPVQSFRGAARELLLPHELASRLGQVARRCGATPFMALAAGWSAVLSRHAGQEDLLLGVAVANRTRPEVEGLIGFFVNTLPLRVRPAADATFRRLLAAVRDTALAAFARQDIPFELLVEQLRPRRDLGRNPLVQAVLVQQGAGHGAVPAAAAATGAPRLVPVRSGARATAKMDLILSVEESREPEPGLALDLEYAADLFDGATAARLLAHLVTLLAAAAETPERRVGELPLLASAERHQAIVEWNDTAAAFPRRALHVLFAEQAAARPDAVALSWDDAEATAGGAAASGAAPGGPVEGGAAPAVPGEAAPGGPVLAAMTFGELARHAAVAGQALRRLGVGREARVALLAERSPAMIVAVLGILEAGGVYLPLDPTHPPERLALLLADARPAAVTGPRRLLAGLPAALPRLAFEDLAPAATAAPPAFEDPAPAVTAARPAARHGGRAIQADQAERRPAPRGEAERGPERALDGDTAAEALAYVLYTSGSTGAPKGVEVSHRAVVRLVRETGYAALGPGEVFLQLAPMAFDAATLELWAPLANGGRLALFPPRPLALPDLYAAVARHGVTTLWLTAGLFHLAVDEGIAPLAGLRQLLAGGDALARGHVQRALAALPGVALLNGYGPTENTTFSCTHAIRGGGAGEASVPIGRPIAGSRALVLDPQMGPVPAGTAGELYVGGEGLARGYLGRTELTAERFVPDPFGRPGERLYRTGDLVRRCADGTLEFLGRRDLQVKVRGFRVELGEVESALARHPGVREAVVVATPALAGTDRRLAAFYVPAGEAIEASALRAFVRRLLPEPMVPAAFVPLPALPLTASGKVDRRALPVDAAAAVAAAGAVGVGAAGAAAAGAPGPGVPRTPVEEVVAGIWEEVLERRVGTDESFFDLGGHSLLVTRVLSRIREALTVELSVRAFFEHPTVSGLAHAVTAARREAVALALPPLAPATRGELAPLSFPQQRLWFLDRLAPARATYNIPLAWELRGAPRPAALAAALGEIARRHEALRTRFVEVDGEPWQRIDPPRPAVLPQVDLAALAPAAAAAELARLGRAEAGQPFDLARGPLMRARLVRRSARSHVLLLTLHHIVADGWSNVLLAAELAALYGAAAAGRPSPLPELAVQYADFAVWQRGWPRAVLDRQLAYWRRQLAGLGTLAVPTDRPRPPVQTFRGRVERVVVPPALTAALRAAARGRRVTLFMAVLAAWQALFHRVTEQADVAVGSPVANRNRPEVERLIGFFVNLLTLRTDCGGAPSWDALLERVRQVALAAYDHADLPFERLVDELRVPRDLSRQPLVQVMVQVERETPDPGVPGLELAPVDLAGAVAKFDLTLSLVDRGDSLAGVIEHSADLFDRPTVARLGGQLLTLLAAALADPAAPIGSLAWLTAAERHQLLREWNDTAAPFAETVLLHQFFAAAAERAPGAPAAVCAGRELTYGELAARANRLGHLLRDPDGAGLPRGAAVGVWIERSFDMLAAVLGILEAGGHYLPLDAAWPPERVEAILAATGARALVAGSAMLPAVEEMRWRLPALADVVCPGVATAEPPVETVDPEGVRALWDLVAERAVDRVTAGGFISAFTGLPFGDAEVDEYRDRVLGLAGEWLRPAAAVLEIGCGAGLLLWEIAPRVGRVVGVDPSPLTQRRNRERLAAAGDALAGRVELLTGFAHEIDALLRPGDRFDLVLLASTVQFFPGPRYLERVIAAALARLAPDGAVLVADVPNARRRDELRQAIAAHRAGAPADAAPHEAPPGGGAGAGAAVAPPRRELHVDEDLFADLAAALPAAGEVTVHHRRDGFANELRYRYDVLLRARQVRCEGVAEARRAGAAGAAGEAGEAGAAGAGAPARPARARRRRLWTGWHAARRPSSRLPAVASPDDLAYVIHTSGSTGAPKGIAVQHRPVANLIEWLNRTLGVGADDRGLFVTSLCFDLSVYDVFGVLAAGGTVHVATDEELEDPDRLVGLLAGGGITLWDSAPAALARLAPLFPAASPCAGDPASLEPPGAPAAGSRLRLVLLSGDWVPLALPDRVRRAFPAARVVALGGATEATVWSNWYPVGEVAPGWASIPYGRPIANARYHVLDRGMAPCPIGMPGDLYIGGDCLCSGYAGMPETTAAAFLPDPFASPSRGSAAVSPGAPARAPGGGARLYRTGDRARHFADGIIEFLGRLDQQVKVRGYRIELGEIEAALGRHPGVRDAVVAARPAAGGAPHDLRLVAWVVPADPAAPPAAAALREGLRRLLPDYMVPAAFVVLPALPVTANGKLDRKALPEPAAGDGAPGPGGEGGQGGQGGGASAAAAPRGPLEERLAALWREVLGIGAVGRDRSFFELGGHSLLATQLVARVRQALGVELPLRALFQRPVLAELAAEVEERLGAAAGASAAAGLAGAAGAAAAAAPAAAAGAVAPPVAVPRQGELPLSSSQLRLWFLVQLEPQTTDYNLPLTLRLRGLLRPDLLAHSLDEIVRRHEVLRTTYTAVAGRPVAVVAPRLRLPLPLVDLAALPAAARHAEVHRLAQAEGERRFDLARLPLVATLLVRIAAGEHLLFTTWHHIVFDGWSLAVFTRELAALYAAAREGRPRPLPELPLQYLDYAVWQRQWLAGEEARRQLDWWRARLAGASQMLHLPTDRPRPALQTWRGASEPVAIAPSLVRRLRELGLRHGATLFMTLLGGFAVLLSRLARQDDLNVGTFVANRRFREVEPLLGFFVNTLVLRADLAGGPSFAAVLARLRETTLGAYEHQDLPLEALLDEVTTERDLSRTPLFQVMFGLMNFDAGEVAEQGLAISRRDLYQGQRANVDLALWLTEEGEALGGEIHYNVDLFAAATVRRLARHLAGLLAAAAAAPEQPAAALPLLTAPEAHQALHEWSGGGRAWPAPLPVHRLIAEQAAVRPWAPAVVAGDEVLTYNRLDRQAEQLARTLRRLGVGPERVVGLCCPRGPETVAGILGILRAGAAWLPLDPALPIERLAYLLADAGAAAVLAPHGLPAGLAFAGPVLGAESFRPPRSPEGGSATAAGGMAGGAAGASRGGRRLALVPEPASATDPEADARGLAYVLYTSGSSGRPKGVQVEHAALAHFTLAAVVAYGLRPGDRVLQFASPSFDTSVEEIFPCLAAGATLVLRDDAMMASPERFLATCGAWGITVLDLPTAWWHTLAAAVGRGGLVCPPSVRLVILGGERAQPEHVVAWLRAVRAVRAAGGPGPSLVNTYGPTEATVVATGCLLRDDGSGAPIGRPFGGARVWLLDAGLQPVPCGVAGELYIAGDGLARGYLGRPDLTAERFLPCPFAVASAGEGRDAPAPGARLYRTGDLARHRTDGMLDFAGRVDDQVKIRGFRIEPGEIAAVLAAHPEVREAAVVALAARPSGQAQVPGSPQGTAPGADWRLVAYVVPAAARRPEAAELRELLRAQLPAYMVPSDYVVLDALPLTPTGKLDRAALPPPDGGAGTDAAPPQTETEVMLVEIWQELLARPAVGIYDNLFDIGGHSLLVPQLAAGINDAFQLALPLRVLFEAPTVAQLAVVVEAALLAEIESLTEEEAAGLVGTREDGPLGAGEDGPGGAGEDALAAVVSVSEMTP